MCRSVEVSKQGSRGQSKGQLVKRSKGRKIRSKDTLSRDRPKSEGQLSKSNAEARSSHKKLMGSGEKEGVKFRTIFTGDKNLNFRSLYGVPYLWW